MLRTTTALAIAGATAALALAAPAAAHADAARSAAGSCAKHWQDVNTYGEGCKGYPSGYKVEAWAQCVNGKYTYGRPVSASNSRYTWSYAYCSSKHSSLLTGGYILLD